MAFSISPSILKGYIAISSFLVSIQGLISLFLGMNHMIVFNTDSSWIYDYFDVQSLKINLTVYGMLLVILGTCGMIGIFKKKNSMVFVYNIGTIVMFIYAISLMIPIATDERKALPNCLNNKNVQKYEDYSLYMQGFGLCTPKCPCNLNGSMLLLYQQSLLDTLIMSSSGQEEAVNCATNPDLQNSIQNTSEYKSLARLENYYNCQGMCTLYQVEVYQFSNINRGPPYLSTCYSQLVKELDYFYMKAISALSTQIVQLILSTAFCVIQYHQHPKFNKNKNMGFYVRLSQL